MRLEEFFLLIRLRTLGAACSPVIVAWSLAYYDRGTVSLGLLLLVLLSATSIQILTNLVNDKADFKKGVDNEQRAGPKRALQTGLVSMSQLNKLIFLSFSVAIVSGALLVARAGLPILIVGLVSLVLAFLYTSGPFALAYKGLGEIFAFVFFGIVAVTFSYFVFTMSYSSWSVYYGGIIGLFAVSIIAINNFRDCITDKLFKKNTLAVKVGELNYKRGMYTILILPYVLLATVYFADSSRIFQTILPFFTLPLTFRVLTALREQSPGQMSLNLVLASVAKSQLIFSILLVVGLAFDR